MVIVCHHLTGLVEGAVELLAHVEGGVPPLPQPPVIRGVEEVLLLRPGTEVEAMI